MTDQNSLKRVLIVDDEERLLRICSLGLTPLGFEVDTAGDGVKALKKILDKDYNLVLTDLKMPNMRGDELVFEMERLNIRVPVIVMTAYADVESAIKTLKHGAVDYIKKPFSIEELIEIINKVMDKDVKSEEDKCGLKEKLEVQEKEIIEKVLIKSQNNKALAARMLDISERNLWYKIKKYKLEF